MSAKRPTIDLMALTSDSATAMPEAVQRTAPQPVAAIVDKPVAKPVTRPAAKPVPVVTTANLQALAFKVPPVFRKRFRERAASADLKLNELLFAAFEAWEEKQGFKK
jgi:hypothetical protein